jgi:hypothetical protein
MCLQCYYKYCVAARLAGGGTPGYMRAIVPVCPMRF